MPVQDHAAAAYRAPGWGDRQPAVELALGDRLIQVGGGSLAGGCQLFGIVVAHRFEH